MCPPSNNNQSPKVILQYGNRTKHKIPNTHKNLILLKAQRAIPIAYILLKAAFISGELIKLKNKQYSYVVCKALF